MTVHTFNKKLAAMFRSPVDAMGEVVKRYHRSYTGPDGPPLWALKHIRSRMARSLFEASRALAGALSLDPPLWLNFCRLVSMKKGVVWSS